MADGTPNGAPLLEVDRLTTVIETAAGDVRVVDGMSFSLARGETFALLGESGCGKSITALSIMRLLPEAGRVAGGRVSLEGQDLMALPEARMRDLRGGRAAMIFQEPATSLNAVMTVGEQIGESLERHGGLRGEPARQAALGLLKAVGIPDPERRLDEYPFQLSGGMKQRVMIAMALAGEPRLLVADEPTTALDVTIQAQVLQLMRELQASRGMSILLITHDLGVVAEMAHRVAVMYAGEVVEQAPSKAFFATPLHPYSRKLFDSLPGGMKRGGALDVIRGSVPPLGTRFTGCRFADRCDRVMDLCREAPPPLLDRAGHQVRCHLYADGASPGDAPRGAGPVADAALAKAGASLLSVDALQVHFPIRKGLFKRVVGQVRAVDGVSLEIAPGRTLALVGESGCGKTTVGKGILQLVAPTGGRVTLDGDNLVGAPAPVLQRARGVFQIVFQDPYASLNPRMRVAEIIEEGMLALGVGRDEADRAARIDALLAEVGLSEQMRWRYPHEFSGGQRQRIAIARALAVEPRLIICDEPTSALDVSVQAQILNLLKRLQAERGIAYLFITHNISVVEYLAHEVAVMYLGRIVERGPVEAVVGNPRHPYTRALLAAVPRLEPGAERAVIRIGGDLPSPANPPAGCHFHPRCAQAVDACRRDYPGETMLAEGGSVRCHLYGKAGG